MMSAGKCGVRNFWLLLIIGPERTLGKIESIQNEK